MEARELEVCIDQFGTDIYRFCMKLCVNKADAEDLYQQTFFKALESEWRLDWEQNPRALFFTLAHNLWKSSVRKSARRASIAPCSHIDEENKNLLKSEMSVEDDFLKRELHTEVNRIIEELPDKIRIPVILYYLLDLPVEQVAEMMKKPPGTVKSRLFKGRKLIKKRLEEEGYGRQEL